MALVARKSIAAQLLQKSLERQKALAHAKLKLKPKQVESAIVAQVEHNNVVQYNELIKIMREYPLNDDNFKCVVDDCLSCVVLLGRNFIPFVNAVLSLDWVHRDESLVNLFSTFLIGLVTAHTYHCPSVMRCLVKLFQAKGDDWEENGPSPKQVKSWSHIHSIIAQIVAIMPMFGLAFHTHAEQMITIFLSFTNIIGLITFKRDYARTSDILIQIVIESFPYYKAGCYANRSYIHNLIWMSKYLPALREQLMMAIINRMIVMDVNVVEREKNKTETQFEIDTEDPDEVASSLDYSMLEVLNWLEEERDPILHILCNVFERVVLPTYGIRHVQFLLLYTISINQQCADRVLSNLWTVAAGLQGLGPGALATRRTAAGHLAGLLARCVRIPNSRIIHYLKSMTEWCHSYITATQEATTSNDNLKAHGAFHAVCHSVFYLIAFKHRHLFNSKESLLFIESLNLPRLVTCALNPLRSCPPPVTRAFSSVTRAHQVAYCQAIVERNQRHTLQHQEALQYDEWFPYDPYTLPRSGKTIWPLCIEYKDWGKDGDSTQYAGMKRKLEEDDDFLIPSPSQRIASLCNGVSPGFRTSESIYMN